MNHASYFFHSGALCRYLFSLLCTKLPPKCKNVNQNRYKITRVKRIVFTENHYNYFCNRLRELSACRRKMHRLCSIYSIEQKMTSELFLMQQNCFGLLARCFLKESNDSLYKELLQLCHQQKENALAFSELWSKHSLRHQMMLWDIADECVFISDVIFEMVGVLLLEDIFFRKES